VDAEVRRAYAVLELTPPVSPDALRKQYRRLAKRWHPDRHASDPVAHADASDRMRRINDAFRLVASSLEPLAPPAPGGDAAGASPRWAGGSRTASRMTREEIEELVASINRSNDWTLWPSVSRDRWYSLAAVAGYFMLTALLPRPAARVAALGLLFAWIPLCIVWMADSELVSFEARQWFRRVGWALMALPLLMGVLMWLF
jgi:hypothetical protein